MIFSAPRFVVVDDKEQHLLAITQAFQRLGSPCMGIRYNPEEELDRAHFRGVRCLFLDLHLVDGQAGTDHRRHYALIASILEDSIHQSGGPFILVVWTEHAHLSNELRDYLDANIDGNKPHARPLAILSLAKEKFINTGDGVVNEPEELRKAVREAILSNSQLAALLDWETDVLAAAGDTLASLLNLVPTDQRTSAAFAGALDTLLSRLARETVGRPHVELNHRAAIASALAPILSDRILNQTTTPETHELWKKAITRHDDETLANASPNEAGFINRMLHLSMPNGSEIVRPTDWGSVVDLPEGMWSSDEQLRSIFDAGCEELLKDEFKIKQDDHTKCVPRLVRVGAACDYAQKRRGPLSFLLALELPSGLKRSSTAGASEWKSPVFMRNGSQEPFQLHVNVRFTWSLPASACEGWSVQYRLREQLMMLLVTHANAYSSRPGVVQLPIK